MKYTDREIEEKVEHLLSLKNYSKKALWGENPVPPVPQIALFGWSCAGTSTTLNLLRDVYGPQGFVCVSGGDYQRQTLNAGARVEDLSAQDLANPESFNDKQCDGWLIDQALRHEKLIMDARLSPCWIRPGALVIYLYCPSFIRAERLAERLEIGIGKARRKLGERDSSDRQRLSRLYPGCIWSIMDFPAGDVILTNQHSPEEVVSLIKERFADHVQREQKHPPLNTLMERVRA